MEISQLEKSLLSRTYETQHVHHINSSYTVYWNNTTLHNYCLQSYRNGTLLVRSPACPFNTLDAIVIELEQSKHNKNPNAVADWSTAASQDNQHHVTQL